MIPRGKLKNPITGDIGLNVKSIGSAIGWVVAVIVIVTIGAWIYKKAIARAAPASGANVLDRLI